MTPAPKSSAGVWLWVGAAVFMLAEFLLFDAMTSRYHASIYPRWTDQIQYLTDAYTAHDHVEAHGLAAGLKFALTKAAVQGTLHDTAAVVVFWLAGSASRSAALSLNMLAFLAWQAALLYAILRVSGSRVLAATGFGLVLCVAGPWTAEAGSAVDFRLDHAALCLFGVTSCVALLTNGFRSTGWSLAFGAAVGVTVLERFLTGAYFAPIFVCAACWLLTRPDRGLRLRNLVFAGVVAAAMTLPVFWINREGIYQYYWVGHVTGAESDARVRGFDFWHSVRFVGDFLGHQHLGSWFGWTVAGLTGLLLGLRFTHPRKAATGFVPGWLFTALTFLLLPAIILILHRQKSEIVVGILVPGIVLFVLWLWHLLWQRIAFPSVPGWRRLRPVLPALVALGAGASHFVSREVTPPHTPEFLQDAGQINRIADYLFQTSRTAGLAEPNVGIDRIVDFMDGRILRLICYERHRTWVSFAVHLPDSILAPPADIVFFKLKYCDFMILTDFMPDNAYWPYDQQMWVMYPDLKDWCETHMDRIETFNAFDREMSLYQRRSLP